MTKDDQTQLRNLGSPRQEGMFLGYSANRLSLSSLNILWVWTMRGLSDKQIYLNVNVTSTNVPGRPEISSMRNIPVL